VVKVNEKLTVEKNGKNLTLCVLNCYANGYLVDVTLWNHDLDLTYMNRKTFVFAGFRVKKLSDWKFSLVSTVYSKFSENGQTPKGIPFSEYGTYYNLSQVLEKRTVSQILKVMEVENKLYSEV
jgi:hypothetical protein